MTNEPPSFAQSIEQQRLRIPEQENAHPWLGILLDALACIDAGTRAVLAALPSNAPSVACGPGCSQCCQDQLIPVTPLEITGLTWFCLERLKGETRKKVAQRLARSAPVGCPFLVDRRCAVYPLRPIACRRFIVLGRPCRNGEDVWVSRRQDLLLPPPEYKTAADRRMLPHYGVNEPEAIDAALKQERLRSISQLLFACSWGTLAQAMARRPARSTAKK
jgi:hypothetical protein